ncbi:MAG: methylenetetrahydrofolate reductase C-terminal domain-containing protein [Methanosarcinales archaeon]|nr:methylenetetrahydrofolate reductase C-terminal domain-containing protein [Methanosarcinales archaeon]
MIITRPKSVDDILTMLDQFPDANICVVGCGICARKAETGGEPQVRKMVEALKCRGVDVLDGVMVKHACSASSWESLAEENPAIDNADIVLVMSCGAGVSLLGRISDKPVLSALDTTSLGGAFTNETLEALCGMCGECNVGMFAGLCPKSSCPKSQMNGPCGGLDDGKCEVGERDCIWVKIYETLEARGLLSLLDEIRQPVSHNRRL